jgi:hypothetical protein
VSITTNRLIGTAGLSAAAAGAIFIGVQINHPPADVAHLLTTEVTVRETAKVLMCVLALAGFTGMFLRHRGRFGRLGRAGYGLLSAGYPALLAVECIVGYVLPTEAHSNPVYAQHVLNGAIAHGASGGIGAMHALFLACGIVLVTRSVVCCSASRCSAPASWPAGPPCCSPTAPPPPSRWPRCRSPSAARSRCPRASR